MYCFRISIEYFNTFRTVLVAAPIVSAVALLKPTLGCITSLFHPLPSGTIFKQLKSKVVAFTVPTNQIHYWYTSDLLDIEEHGKSVIISCY
jgi:hypothetical protein